MNLPVNSIFYVAIATFLVACFANSANAQTPIPLGKSIAAPTPVFQTDALEIKGKAVIRDIATLPKGLQQKASAQLADLEHKGYLPEADAYIDRFAIANLPPHLTQLELLVPTLQVKLAEISGTAFAQMVFHGIMLEGGGNGLNLASVSRYFSLPNGAVVKLSEWDYKVSGGVLLQKEFINESVNENPAIFFVRKGTNGNAISTLSWLADGKFYSITMSGHVTGKGHANKLVEYARALR